MRVLVLHEADPSSDVVDWITELAGEYGFEVVSLPRGARPRADGFAAIIALVPLDWGGHIATMRSLLGREIDLPRALPVAFVPVSYAEKGAGLAGRLAARLGRARAEARRRALVDSLTPFFGQLVAPAPEEDEPMPESGVRPISRALAQDH